MAPGGRPRGLKLGNRKQPYKGEGAAQEELEQRPILGDPSRFVETQEYLKGASWRRDGEAWGQGTCQAPEGGPSLRRLQSHPDENGAPRANVRLKGVYMTCVCAC